MSSPFLKKEILLGVTGSIAAYKAVEIASRLVSAGSRLQVALTKNAQAFIGATTFEAITGNRVITDMFAPLNNPDIEHISVARRADLFLIAPATANILAKAATGIADDWLSTTLPATRAPILFAPAMNTKMYEHITCQENIATLKGRGCAFVGPGSGALACGEIGPGRLTETAEILEAAALALAAKKDLLGKRVLITSGATHEPLDPVRFIGNRSSGKMGYALAFEALRRGAEVTVVTGPASAVLPHAATIIPVQTAQEMHDAVLKAFGACDLFIGAAAVGDYRSDQPATEKHKRGPEALTLRLIPNPDIVASVGQIKKADQLTVGFAAETNDLLLHAAKKLDKKRLDFIVANEVGGPHCAFGAEAAKAWLLAPNAEATSWGQIPKAALAERLFDALAARLDL